MRKFWRWYNQIKEPYRMFFFLFVIAIPMHLGNFLITVGQVEIGSMFMLIMLILVISWLRYLKSEKNEKKSLH
jgi:hypothetical protein